MIIIGNGAMFAASSVIGVIMTFIIVVLIFAWKLLFLLRDLRTDVRRAAHSPKLPSSTSGG